MFLYSVGFWIVILSGDRFGYFCSEEREEPRLMNNVPAECPNQGALSCVEEYECNAMEI